ncbi:MAG: ABC transporter substrate-binding protein, partial [Chloroflexus sp.]
PDIVVKYEPITGDYWATLKTMIASGTEPDIYYMDIFQFPFFAKEGVLLPLDDLMASTGTRRDAFIPDLINAFTYEGKTYGIPKDFNTLGMFYNKDLFDAAGLAYPTDDWTWDDLRDAAAKLTNLSDPNRPVYGFCTPPDPGRFPVFVFQNGGTVMNGDFTDTTLDSEAAVKAAEFYASFPTNQIGALPSDLGEGWQGTLFGKGQCAMVYEGGWLIPYLRDQFPNTKYGVVMPPAGPGGEGNLIFTVAWGISANTKNAEAAWKVVNFLTSEASQKAVLESGFALPSRQALQNSDYLKNNPNSAAIFNGSFFGARPFFWGLVGSDVNDQMSKALERMFKENQPASEAMKQAAESIRKAMR